MKYLVSSLFSIIVDAYFLCNEFFSVYAGRIWNLLICLFKGYPFSFVDGTRSLR